MVNKLIQSFQSGAFGSLSDLLSQGSFKYLLIGVTSHAFTLWMEIVARNWLIWEMTGSVAAVGLVNFWRTIPILFLAVPVVIGGIGVCFLGCLLFLPSEYLIVITVVSVSDPDLRRIALLHCEHLGCI